LLNAEERAVVDAALAAAHHAKAGNVTAAINRAIGGLNEATGEFAARRMNRNLQQVLTGQNIRNL
jgi:molecular chaperone HscA